MSKEESEPKDKPKEPKESKKLKSATIYLLINFELDKKEIKNDEILFKEEKTRVTFSEKTEKETKISYNVVIEHCLKSPKKRKQFEINFKIENNNYIIIFEYNGNHFIYNLELNITKSFINIKKIITQKITNTDKFNLFHESLKNLNQESLYTTLYEDTISVYSMFPKFDFLINIFLKINKIKELCPKLLEEFKNFNSKITNSIKDKNYSNINYEEYLNEYNKEFEQIIENSEKIISSNGYNPTYFYGLILCYLNHYNKEAFEKLLTKLSESAKLTLFEILQIYNHFFKKNINLKDSLLVEFVGYSAEQNKENFEKFNEKGLFYLNNVNLFMEAINVNKDKIISIKGFKPININIFENYKNIDIKKFQKDFNDILEFSENKKQLLIAFLNVFWENLGNLYQNSTQENILICKDLRDKFLAYHKLVIENCKINIIKKEAKEFYEKDIFAFILDKIIKNYIKESKTLQNIEIVKLVMDYDPYYFPKETNYGSKRNPHIFERLNFDNVDEDFKNSYKEYKFEDIFKDKLGDYIALLGSKITNILHFEIFLDLINKDKIGDKKKSYEELLKNKYEVLITKYNSLENKEKEPYNKIISVLYKLLKFFYDEGKLKSLVDKIKIIKDENLKLEIFIKLSELNHSDIKKYLESIFFGEINSYKYDNFIRFLNNVNDEYYFKLMERLKDKYMITEEDFYSKSKSINIELCYNLKENKLLKEDEKNIYYGSIKIIYGQIYTNLEEEKISISNLISMLSGEEEDVIKKLTLLKDIANKAIDPKDKYGQLMKLKDDILEKSKHLLDIKTALEKYLKQKYNEDLNLINNINKRLYNGTVIDYTSNKIDIDNLILKFQEISNNINYVKDSLIFNYIYKEEVEKDERQKFENANNKFLNLLKGGDKNSDIENLLRRIKNEIDSNQLQEELNSFIGKENINEKYMIYVKSDKHQKNIDSIFYFFSNIPKDDEEWNKIFSLKYKDMNKKSAHELFECLKELQKNGIYDYSKEEDYLRFFTCLYELKEAYNFLLNQTTENIQILYEKIEPNNQKIKLKDIDDAFYCVGFFQEIKKMMTNLEIFNYIKNISLDKIKSFENFSCNYSSIIELSLNNDLSLNLYEKIREITKDATFIFYQEDEIFSYKDKEGKIQKEKNLDRLKHLYNQIHIKPIINNSLDKNEENNKKFIEKYKMLCNFKEIVNNIEMIYDYMVILRRKGSSLPIIINININDSKAKYFLGSAETTFDKIQNYLLNARNFLINKLDEQYKEKANLRFIYGKQFESIMKHLNSKFNNINPFLRYILNVADNEKEIEEGFPSNPRRTNDYIEEYKLYTENSFENISNYITSLFENNKTSYEKHYSKMLIKDKNIYKGIYLYHSTKNQNQLENISRYSESNSKNSESENIIETEFSSMEGDILNIFLDYTGRLPIAQNILISNKETSEEEIQAFFSRAILCKFNTLFVFEINNSFSDNQRKIMNNIIDKLLIYKNKLYNEKENDNIEKSKTREYMDSCLIFIYNDECNPVFLNEIQKLTPPKFPLDRTKSFMSYGEKNHNNMNVHVISSEICGLGKSTKIKNTIIESGKKYFYFPLGGNLTKNKIYSKLSEIIKNTEVKTKNSYKDIAIHLDLYETKETSILNEFLFCFIITKFYSNNENIIYIPKNIEIYIEIPNCFRDFISNYDILQPFKDDPIKIGKLPALKLPEEKIKLFNSMLELDTNEKIYNYIIDKMKLSVYSYHQINIFINLFINQYNKFGGKKLTFLENEEDVTDECIKNFAKGTNYFTYGCYAKLLTQGARMKDNNLDVKEIEKYFINEISTRYKNDINNHLYESPLIFIIKERMEYIDLDISDNALEKYYGSSDYLYKLKYILSLENEIFKEKGDKKALLDIINKDNYVITNDNFRKMILILYRIISNVPVILMGETGCGKTFLIKKLNQLLNNGEETLSIINIDPGFNDKKLIEKMKEVNKKAIELGDKNLWLFLDELNTCDSLSLIKEIFINRTFNGIKMEENIRIIGACNPYRKKMENKQKSGLQHPNDINNDLIYSVNLLPQSLLYYVFNFGSVSEDDEKKYISSIIDNLFTEHERELKIKTENIISECHKYLRKTYDYSVVSLRELSRFNKCCNFFYKSYFVEKNKFNKVENNEELNKIKSIIISIYICYYIRLTDETQRANFDNILDPLFLELANYKDNNSEITKGDLLSNINEPLRTDLQKEMTAHKSSGHKSSLSKLEHFSQILTWEEYFILNEIKPEKGIGWNKLLRENIFLLFIALVTQIPLIIIGKPGSGKSLSAQLMYKTMRGEFSKSKFFQNFPKIIQTYFQGSNSTIPDDVENIFEIAAEKIKILDKKKNISMILFDELGLAERAKSNPLKVLHSKLEYDGNEKGVSFVGISNWSLDAAKINRALSLSVPDLDSSFDDIKETAISIAKSINENIGNEYLFESLLSWDYYEYKNALKELRQYAAYKRYMTDEFNSNVKKYIPKDIFEKKLGKKNFNYEKDLNFYEIMIIKKDIEKIIKNKNMDVSWMKEIFEGIFKNEKYIQFYNSENSINIDFHGNRDFYFLIKGIARDLYDSGDNNKNSVAKIIEKSIERNFGGMEIDIDKKENYEFNSFKIIKEILKLINFDKNTKKISSVCFFKLIHNRQVNKIENSDFEKPEIEGVKEYKILKNIVDNINDLNSRFILLEIKPSLAPLIFQNIAKEVKRPKEDIKFYEGSPFANDNDTEYRFKMINIVQESAAQGYLLVLQNLDQIYAFLYDLFNLNYIQNNGKNYARICHGNNSEQLVLIHPSFKCIIMVDKKFIDNVDPPFLNRFEKIIISFEQLLNPEQKKLYDEVRQNDLNLTEIMQKIDNSRKINYNLKNLLIGCKKQDIQGLIYYLSDNNNEQDTLKEINENNNNNNLKIKISEKIAKLIPQDIIINLPDNNLLKKIYFEQKHYYNLSDYLKEIDTNKYKISIIYTFSSSDVAIEGIELSSSQMISEIQSEKKLANLINEKLRQNKSKKNNNKYVVLQFDSSQSKKLSFIINFIITYYSNEDYKYICIIHIKRSFKDQTPYRISNIFDVYPNVNQLFIDNLKGAEISLYDILKKPQKTILEENNDLEEIFFKVLKKFISYLKSENLDENLTEEKYDKYAIELEETFKYEENSFMYDILEKAKSFIQGDGKDIIPKIYEEKYINKNSLDIVSIIKDYISDVIFEKILLDIFLILEDNNFITTIMVLNTKKKNLLSKEIINEMKERQLQILDLNNNNNSYDPDPKYNESFIIPGFYNFYKELSDFISYNIAGDCIKNENKLRKFVQGDINEVEKIFHDKEKDLLNNLYQKVRENNMIFDILSQGKIDLNLVLQDYITFYLLNYYDKINHEDEIYHKFLYILLDLRFNEEHEIYKINVENHLKILLLKISWIESNKDNILYLLDIYYFLKNCFKNEDDLLKNIKKKIDSKSIKYITNEDRNPKHTKEVNECFYIILAAICISILPQNIKINDFVYFESLQKSLKLIQYLDDNLDLFLNEMYIIDEINEIHNSLILNGNEEDDLINSIFNDIIKNIITNNEILQSSDEDKYEKLSSVFTKFYELLNKVINYESEDYYKLLYKIFYKEIRKVADIGYRKTIFEYLIKDNEIIRISNEIFQLLLKKLIVPTKDRFIKTINYILMDKGEIGNIIENILKNENENNFITLSETLIYFFEKNSHIYLDNIFKDKTKTFLEKEPLDVFMETIKYLNDYLNHKEKIKDKNNINMCKLFCIAYIKTFCFTFVSMMNDNNNEFLDKNSKNSTIIESIKNIDINNKISDKQLGRTIKLYIYKIIYNLNHRQFEVFLRGETILKFKIKDYEFKDFIDINENNFLNYKNRNTLKENKEYETFYEIIDKYKNNNFEKVDYQEFDLKVGIDIFFFTTSNLIYFYFNSDDSREKNIYLNFNKNVLVPLFKDYNYDYNKISKALQLFYYNEKFDNIVKEFQLIKSDLKILLISYRYCLNEIYSQLDKGNESKIYYKLYQITKTNLDNINFYFPGNDIGEKEIYNLASKIEQHFSGENSKRACYVCLCKNGGYYHNDSIIQKNTKSVCCQKCGKELWRNEGYLIFNSWKPIKSSTYYRIFKDKNDLEKNNDFVSDYEDRMKMITKEEFFETFLKKDFESEKGITKVSVYHLKRDNKVVRNLSQVSYRLLNFILYSHLFFARLYTENKKLDSYLPSKKEKKLSWKETLNCCWELLKNELNKLNVCKIELFMNYIFCDLFRQFTGTQEINDYDDLVSIEKKLDEFIMKKIDDFIQETKNYEKLIKPDKNDKFLPINLLEEQYDYCEQYPLNNYFHYSEYITIDYLKQQIYDLSKYPVLDKYLKDYNQKDLILDNLTLFNDVLNLFKERYSLHITREEAENEVLCNNELYIKNKKEIDDFIKYYNKLGIKDSKNKKIELSNKNKLYEFFIDDGNEIGKSYIKIYEMFISEQNNQIKDILDLKIEDGIFDKNCKNEISIQNIKPNEIFSFKSAPYFSFIEIIFNNSFRKALVTNNFKDSFNLFEIDFDKIEENMTDIFIKNKKMLNEDISKFIYKNEDLFFDNIDIVTKFNDIYNINSTDELSVNDKLVIYNFIQESPDNTKLFLDLKESFQNMIIYLNNHKNDKKNRIDENSKIYNSCLIIEKNMNISKKFIELFKNSEIIITKLSKLFEYYLILIYPVMNREFQEYEEVISEEKINEVNEYFKTEHTITKDIFAFAIRLFISSFLSEEKNKEKKIKKNINNIINYLDIPDIWKNKINKKNEFRDELNQIKKLKIQLNQIFYLSKILGEDIDKNYLSDVLRELEKREEEKKAQMNQENENNNIKNDIKAENKDKEKEDEEKEEEEEEEEKEEIDEYYIDPNEDDNDYYQDKH